MYHQNSYDQHKGRRHIRWIRKGREGGTLGLGELRQTAVSLHWHDEREPNPMKSINREQKKRNSSKANALNLLFCASPSMPEWPHLFAVGEITKTQLGRPRGHHHPRALRYASCRAPFFCQPYADLERCLPTISYRISSRYRPHRARFFLPRSPIFGDLLSSFSSLL